MDLYSNANTYTGCYNQTNEWPDDLQDLRLYPLSSDPHPLISTGSPNSNHSDDEYQVDLPEKDNASYHPSYEHSSFYDGPEARSDDTFWHREELHCTLDSIESLGHDLQYNQRLQDHVALRTPLYRHEQDALHPSHTAPFFEPNSHQHSLSPGNHKVQRSVPESFTSPLLGEFSTETPSPWNEHNYSGFSYHSTSAVQSDQSTTPFSLSACSSYDSFRDNYRTPDTSPHSVMYGASPESSDHPDKPAEYKQKRNRLPKSAYDQLTEKEKKDRKKALNKACSANYSKRVKVKAMEVQKESNIHSDRQRALTHEKVRLEKQVKIMCKALDSLGNDFRGINLNHGYQDQ